MSINNAFYLAIKDIANDVPISYPNLDFSSEIPYYKLNCMPGTKFAVGLNSLDRQGGFCQVACYVRDGDGEPLAEQMAENIIQAFPRGTIVEDGSLKIQVNQPPYYSGGINTNNGWFFIPVTINFTILTR